MANSKSQVELMTEISEKLDSILGLLAIRGIEDDWNAVIQKLMGMGLNARTIVPIAGLSENAVNIRLSRIKKKQPGKIKKEK